MDKYFQSQVREMLRSEIKPADYNPRKIDAEGKKNLKRSLKKFGVLGGIIVNERTGYTVVGGHQKVAILDEINKYPENDYKLRVEVINVEESVEKTINITLNNPNVGGDWDYDKMRAIVPDINYKDAGLSDADLSMIGLDYLYQTEQQIGMASSLQDLMAEANAEHAKEVEQRRIEREAMKAQMRSEADELMEDEEDEGEYVFDAETDRQERIQAMKNLKAEVKEKAEAKAMNMDAYITLSFSTWDAKQSFCTRFGISPYEKFFKGELFDEMCERVLE